MNRKLLIVLMMVVTYIPRLIPFLALGGKKENPGNSRVKRFLSYIPYAALGALIFPGGLFAVEVSSVIFPPVISLLGLLSAAAVSFFIPNVGLSVLAAILVVFTGLSL